mmetsp:Transcript_11703/g.36359  ORF Transcript_11703/g.36359 Transcript_11703/m.36359 type:complete len:311 (-) Transcript_11703:1907-2839(-)
MSWIDQSFISARNVPVKLGYLQQILRTRWLSSGGNVLPLKESLQSPEHWLSSLLDLLLSLEPQAGSRAWKRGALAGGHFGLAEFDWKVLRKAIISSRDFPVTSNCLSPQACWSCGTERVSQRCSCRSRERADLSRAEASRTSGTGTPRSAHSLQRSSAFILSQLKSCFSSRRRSDLSERASARRPRLRHSARKSETDMSSHFFTCRRLSRISCLSEPPKMPRRSASAWSSSSDHKAHLSSSDRSSCEAFCASDDLASAMMRSVRPLRSSESWRARPCSVRRAILRQEPLLESLTISFLMSRMQTSPGTEI